MFLPAKAPEDMREREPPPLLYDEEPRLPPAVITSISVLQQGLGAMYSPPKETPPLDPLLDPLLPPLLPPLDAFPPPPPPPPPLPPPPRGARGTSSRLISRMRSVFSRLSISSERGFEYRVLRERARRMVAGQGCYGWDWYMRDEHLDHGLISRGIYTFLFVVGYINIVPADGRCMHRMAFNSHQFTPKQSRSFSWKFLSTNSP
jgi:hypothetical protein